MKRRTFLKGTVAGGTVAVAAGAGLLKPTEVLAAAWPTDAFKAKDVATAVAAMFGDATATASDGVKIKAPTQAENGAVVPFKVTTDLPGVETIAVVVKNNPSPLVTSLATMATAGFYSTRIKMGKSSPVTAYVKANGKLYTATQTIKVTVGGCGG